MNENEKLEKEANIEDMKIGLWTKVAIWLFISSVTYLFVLFVVTDYVEVQESTMDILFALSPLFMFAAFYGSLFFLAVVLGAVVTFFYKFKLIKRFVDGTVSFISWLFMMALGAFWIAVIVLAIYLAYLFVLWAGLIGTLLTIIAALLLVLVILSASRH